MTRYGDYIVCLSITLNASAMIAYLWQGHYAQTLYWLCALGLNVSLLWMRRIAGPAFGHYERTDLSGGRPLPPHLLRDWLACKWLVEPEPCDCPIEPADIVLDPFAGSGTTIQVAQQLGRHGVGIELNADYIALAEQRLMQESLPL